MDSTLAAKVFSRSTVQEVFDDLCVRFIVHLPKVELMQVERICFQIEEAHWFYEDFIRDLNPTLPNYNLKMFIQTLISHIPPSLTSQFESDNIGNAFASFMAYKQSVPVRGAIMLNLTMDKCVLVKGWKSSATWAFPRGKIDAEENDLACAIREVAEETNFDLTGYISEADCIEMTLKAQNIRLYVAPGVPEDVEFAPRTRKEISKIQWHNLSDLPGYNSKRNAKEQYQQRTGRYYMVAPFMKGLKRWIATKGKKWLLEQQKKASVQHKAEFSDAAANIPAVEYETEVEDGPRSPPKDPAEGLRALLGIDRAREVLQHGQMTQTEQEDASRRLKDMLLGKKPSAIPPSHDVGQNGMFMNGNDVAKTAPNPNAQSLLSILKGGTPAPQQPSHPPPPQPFSQPPPPPQLQENMPIPFASQMEQFSPFAGQQPQSFSQPPQFASRPPPAPSHLAGYGPMPGFPPFNPHQQQQPRDMPPLFQNGAGIPPQFAHLNEWQNPPMTPTTPTTNQHQNPSQHIGAFPTMKNQPGAPLPPHQAPPTPKESFLPIPPPPNKPTDAAQAGALLSILKGTIAPPSASPAPAPPPAPASVATSAPAPAISAVAQPPLPATSKTSKQQQGVLLQMLNPNIQQQKQQQPPQQPIPPRQARNTPPPTRQRPGSNPTSPRRPAQHQPQNHLPVGPRGYNARRRENIRPSTTLPQNVAYPPPPVRPGSVQPQPAAKPSPLLRNMAPTVIDQYGVQKPASPVTVPASFDRRKSMTGDRAASLLAMFTSPGNTAPTTVESPEVKKEEPQLARLGTPVSQQQAKAKSPMGKERENLLAYLEGVAKMG